MDFTVWNKTSLHVRVLPCNYERTIRPTFSTILSMRSTTVVHLMHRPAVPAQVWSGEYGGGGPSPLKRRRTDGKCGAWPVHMGPHGPQVGVASHFGRTVCLEQIANNHGVSVSTGDTRCLNYRRHSIPSPLRVSGCGRGGAVVVSPFLRQRGLPQQKVVVLHDGLCGLKGGPAADDPVTVPALVVKEVPVETLAQGVNRPAGIKVAEKSCNVLCNFQVYAVNKYF